MVVWYGIRVVWGLVWEYGMEVGYGCMVWDTYGMGVRYGGMVWGSVWWYGMEISMVVWYGAQYGGVVWGSVW